MTSAQFIFLFFAVVVISGAGIVVTARNLIRATLCMVLCFFGVAGLFLAYSSVNHMGLAVLGIATVAASITRVELKDATVMAGNGGVMQMFNHGITSTALFLLVGILYERTHTRELNEFGGLGLVVPIYSGILLFSALASLGLPGLNGFVGEYLLFRGAWSAFTLVTTLATLGLLFTGAYPLWMIQRVLYGPLNKRWASLREVKFREIAVVVPLLAFMSFSGLWPRWNLTVINDSITRIFG